MLSRLPLALAFIAAIALCSDTAAATCACPDNPDSLPGIFDEEDPGGIQCAFPAGACIWDESGTLLNTAQQNCPFFIDPDGFCPAKDNTGASGVFIARLFQFSCSYDTPDFGTFCTWNAAGELDPSESDGDCPTANVPPCVES